MVLRFFVHAVAEFLLRENVFEEMNQAKKIVEWIYEVVKTVTLFKVKTRSVDIE